MGRNASMSLTLFALGALLSAAAAPPQTAAAAPPAQTQVNRFEGRPQARIAFSRQIQNFQVKREGNDDILYLETSRDRWYRSEISCFGISDPRDAQGLLPLDRSGSLDSFSKIHLVGFSNQQNECTLRSLIELTTEEATELRLIRRRTPRTKAATP
jgi:hypothetical protein